MRQLFVDTSRYKWNQNVVVGGKFTTEYSYPIGFWEAADYLVEKAVQLEAPYKDRLFYPIGSNYRQFIELTLKQLIILVEKFYKKCEVLGFQRRTPLQTYSDLLNDTHSLERLLNMLTDLLDCVAEEQFNPEIRKLIIEYHNFDPFGQRFRYPTSTQNEVYFPEKEMFDIVKIKDGVTKIAKYFMGIDGYIDHYDSMANGFLDSLNTMYAP
jgi:hypothetical protein